ncbi:zeta toxin family protein [Streptomyces sp. NPDC005209]|uniref:zeta toxin family protein n=1 Tax=Streptomyces sp. NPDC005209 TaxID=3156715 RepID=UPI0033B88543
MVNPEEHARPFLTDRQAAQIYNRRIRPTITGTAQDNPVAVFTAAQPGAGKTTLRAAFLEMLGRQDAYLLDGDALLAQHPRFEALSRNNDLTAATIVGEELAGRWWTRSARLVRIQRLDVLIDSPLGFEEWATGRFREFANRDYALVGAFLAVHEATSLQGMVHRLHEARRPDREGYGRFPPIEIHDAAYAGVLDTADRFDESGHAVYVLRRGPAVLHRNERRPDGSWDLAVSTRQAIIAERQRPWNGQESAAFLQRQGELRAAMTPEWRDILDQVDARAADVINPLTLLDDVRLADYQRQSAHALDAARRLAEQSAEHSKELTRQYRTGESARKIEQLRELGATPEQVARAVDAQREDRWHAGRETSVRNDQVRQLQRTQASVQTETARRAALDPKQRILEQAGRQQHVALHPARAQVTLPSPQGWSAQGPTQGGLSL